MSLLNTQILGYLISLLITTYYTSRSDATGASYCVCVFVCVYVCVFQGVCQSDYTSTWVLSICVSLIILLVQLWLKSRAGLSSRVLNERFSITNLFH